MATLCIILRDNLRPGHRAPHTAARPGDIVAVYEDGVAPGTKTIADPDFALIRLPGIPRAKVEFLLDPVVADVTDPKLIPTQYRRHKYLPELLTKSQLDKAKATGLAYDSAVGNVAKDAIHDHVENKTTGRTLQQDGVTI